MRWRLKGNLWIHVYEFQKQNLREHLERAHYYMELLKGHTVLHRLVGLNGTSPSLDIDKWNRYAASLPVRVDRTAVADLSMCTKSLPDNAIGLSFYFLCRDLLPDLLLLVVLQRDKEPCLKIVNGTERLKKYQTAAELLQHVHDLVAWRQKVPSVGRTFCALTGEKEQLSGTKLVTAVAEYEQKQLSQAYEAVLEGLIDEEELQGKDVYISPSPEMYDIPFGLLCSKKGFLNTLVQSITIVPIFSLHHSERPKIFEHADGLVLSLDPCWEEVSSKRVAKLSQTWCKKPLTQQTEHQLPAFTGDPTAKYKHWTEMMPVNGFTHIIGHHDTALWSKPPDQVPNLAQFGKYLYEAPVKLSVNGLALEACWGGTWSNSEDMMGMFVSFLANDVSWIIASPYSVVPNFTCGKLFDYIYEQPLTSEYGPPSSRIACILRDAAESVRHPTSPTSEDIIPSLWGALQLYASLSETK